MARHERVYSAVGQKADHSFAGGPLGFIEHHQNDDYLRKLNRNTMRGTVVRPKRGLWASRLVPSVERWTISIAGPAIASLIQTQGMGDLYRIYVTAQRDGLGFHLAYIDEDFTAEHVEDFDTGFMQALFDYGFRQGREGYRWKLTPPLLGEAAPP